MIGDILRGGVVGGVAAHESDSGSLVDSDIVDEVGSGEGEVGEIDFLEIVRHSKVEDLNVSTSTSL